MTLARLIKMCLNETYSKEINVEETKYVLLSRYQNAVQNLDIKMENRSFENVSYFKYLGTTVTNQNLIQDEIKKRLSSGNACYHSVQSLLSSSLLSKNLKMRIYTTIILPVILYGGNTWSLTLRLRVFENKMLRSIFGPKTNEVTGGWRKNLHNKELRDLYSSPRMIRLIKSRRMRKDGACSPNGGNKEMRIGYWLENQRERDH
jgi:hypothetical protein